MFTTTLFSKPYESRFASRFVLNNEFKKVCNMFGQNSKRNESQGTSNIEEHRQKLTLTKFFRRLDHLHDVVEQVGVDDGHIGVLHPQVLDGVSQQRVVELHDLVRLLETAGGDIVFRSIGVLEGDEDRRRASGRDHPRDD